MNKRQILFSEVMNCQFDEFDNLIDQKTLQVIGNLKEFVTMDG